VLNSQLSQNDYQIKTFIVADYWGLLWGLIVALLT
jgi:hypothetical protein